MIYKKYMVINTGLPIDNGFNYYVQEWRSTDGETFYYTGGARYFKTLGEAEQYREEMQSRNPLPERSPRRPPTVRNGKYYYMDCQNAFVSSGLFPVSEFEGEADAIRTAADYEATLFLLEYRNGEQVSSSTLYEPNF